MKTVTSVTSKNTQYEIGDAKARREKLNRDELPSNLSAFQNDLHFIDNTVNNLLNYYKKSETYTKEQVDSLLATRWSSQFVQELPTENISPTTIYFLRRNKPEGTNQYESDIYDEYIYVGQWELIGNTYVDLSDYYTKAEAESMADAKILAETQARQQADLTLQNNIDGVQSNLNTTNSNLSAETLARQQTDLRHDDSITTLTENLSNEITRATNVESALSDRIDVTESHLSDETNPHNVTAEQVGLGNVTNVGTTDTITPNSEENITSGAVYEGLNEKVDKVDGKGLSDQNFTYAEKTKLSELSNYDDTALKNRITTTENAITTLNGDSSVNGSVDKKIADAIGGITSIDFQIVSSLPASGVKGVIYFVQSESTETKNIYNEYVWVGNAFEKIGEATSTIDLTDYYTKAQVGSLVSVKQDKITITNDTTALTDSDSFDETPAGTNQTTTKRRPLTTLWNYIKTKIDTDGVNGITFEIV